MGTLLGHFGQGHFGHGPYGLDISATENADGGHFRVAITINLRLGCVHVKMCDALINLLKSNMHVNTFSRLKMHDNRVMLFFIEIGKLWCILYSSKWYIPV